MMAPTAFILYLNVRFQDEQLVNVLFTQVEQAFTRILLDSRGYCLPRRVNLLASRAP